MVLKVTTDEQILAVHEVMQQLRPNISRNDFLATVKRMQETDGYQLAAVYEEGAVRAVAGYRVIEMLWCGKILYVDDLSTDERFRSKGYGKVLLDWLKNEARALGCGELHLDSGVQRQQAHKFYFREGLTITAIIFVWRCDLDKLGLRRIPPKSSTFTTSAQVLYIPRQLEDSL